MGRYMKEVYVLTSALLGHLFEHVLMLSLLHGFLIEIILLRLHDTLRVLEHRPHRLVAHAGALARVVVVEGHVGPGEEAHDVEEEGLHHGVPAQHAREHAVLPLVVQVGGHPARGHHGRAPLVAVAGHVAQAGASHVVGPGVGGGVESATW